MRATELPIMNARRDCRDDRSLQPVVRVISTGLSDRQFAQISMVRLQENVDPGNGAFKMLSSQNFK